MTDKESVFTLAEEKGACTHKEHWEIYPHRISFGPDELFAFAKAVQDMQREKSAEIVKAFEPDDIDLYNAIRANTSTETDIDRAQRLR